MSHPSKQLPQAHRQTMEEATAEAEARPVEYDPAERATYVRKTLREIAQWKAQGDTEETIRQRIPEFVEAYPELFKKVNTGQSLEPIKEMLKMLDHMAEKKISQHQASVRVGKLLVDRYVTPQLKGNGGNTSGR